MGVELDHLLWAAPDLDAGTALLGQLTGVAPAPGGSHAGFGTRNSLMSAGGGVYLEVIAPDPAQDLAGTMGETLAALMRPGLFTFAVRTRDLDAYARAAAAAGVGTRGPVAMGRTRPDGVRLDWRCLYVDHAAYGRSIPFAIDWQDSPHPAASVPRGCTLRSFAALHPDAAGLAAIYRALGVDVAVRAATSAGFLALLDTPAGEVALLGP